MDRKNEKALVTLADEELSAVAGAGDINISMFNAVADHGSVATSGIGNFVDASKDLTSLFQAFDFSQKFFGTPEKK